MEEIEIGCSLYLISLYLISSLSIQRLTLRIADFYQPLILFITEIALKKIDRVDVLVVKQDLIMQVGRNGSAGTSDITNDISTFYSVARPDHKFRQVRITGFITMAMFNINDLAICFRIVCLPDLTVASCINRCAC